MRNFIEFHDQVLKKTFVGENTEEKKYIKDNYERELKAYQRFMQLNADFVPELLDFDQEKLILFIQKINGLNLVNLFNQNEKEICNNINIDLIIDQLIRIDAFLYDHRINVLQTSPKDIIYDYHQQKVFLTDFEFTVIDSSYKQILYNRMFQNNLARASNNELRSLFWDSLKKRKKEFKHYNYRKLKNYLTKRIRLFLPLPRKKIYQNSKISVLY